ncbi:aquaporin [Apilactobacillus apisilvae]|uniref:Aquaporin n=1 Tax=Apilactobacillus apisilvae TaxID=2923364 RepID=A0ABY4PFC5_9LACO|nr:aquaporin [Apilactobacillus apisilvae]UQS84419.1 aquaporin [Apilactobacillus apisilvae]
MKLLIGEFVGTYLMLSLGLVSSVVINYFLFPKHQNRWLTGFYWGISILIPSFITTLLFGTAGFNPVVSLTLAVNDKISFWLFIGEVIMQTLGAWLASSTVNLVWSKWLRSLPLNLNLYATVPRNLNKWKTNFIWEMFGTFIIVINMQAMSNIVDSPWWIKTIWSSILMTIIISIIAPITGAAFNPVRDLIPRLFFSRTYDKGLSQWKYSIIPLLGPLVGGILGIIFSFLVYK